MTDQRHDISPANGENIGDPDPVFHLPGLFWLVRLGKGQWEGVDDDTWKLSIHDLYEVDRLQLFGPGDIGTRLDVETTYTRVPGKPTVITAAPCPDPNYPPTGDPANPFCPNSWSGLAWQGHASGTFMASYADGSWWVRGTVTDANGVVEDAPGNKTGHIVLERNGVFVTSHWPK